MKKLLLYFFIFIGVVLLVVYIFIPSKIKFSAEILMNANESAVNRFLVSQSQWLKWLPHDSSGVITELPDVRTLRHNDHTYTVESALMNTVQVSIKNPEASLNSLMRLISINEDSVALEWKGEIAAGRNPISRLKSYNMATEIQEDMTDILDELKKFAENQENVYGITITQTKVVDTLLIATKFVSEKFPSTSEIYSAIKDLREYISEEGAQETNPPMLNISDKDSTYRTMIAIPVNKKLPEKNNYVFKRMVPGKILVAEIKGGVHTAKQALKQIEFYINDHNLSSPAIPFESLITNRSLEPDTAKWITKIYYPIY